MIIECISLRLDLNIIGQIVHAESCTSNIVCFAVELVLMRLRWSKAEWLRQLILRRSVDTLGFEIVSDVGVEFFGCVVSEFSRSTNSLIYLCFLAFGWWSHNQAPLLSINSACNCRSRILNLNLGLLSLIEAVPDKRQRPPGIGTNSFLSTSKHGFHMLLMM